MTGYGRKIGMAIAACMLAAVTGWAQSPSLDQAFKELPGYKFGQSREGLTVISDAVRDSQSNPQARAGLVAKLEAALKGEASFDAKQFVCRQLCIAGTETSVPVIAPLLSSKETCDIARYALERIPGEAVDKALLKALGTAKDGEKVGIINTLGARRCAAAVNALAPLAKGKDLDAKQAAVAALGRIGNKAAASALIAAKCDCPAWTDAYLLCADRLAASGDKSGAKKIYDALSAASYPEPVRVAAFLGRAGDAGVPAVLEALRGSDKAMRGAATRFVREMKGQDATAAFAGVLPKLDADGQVLLLKALEDRNDNGALPAVREAAKSQEAAVRAAAWMAMGKLGSAACVMDLAKAAASSQKPEAEAASSALALVPGKDIDGAIVDSLKGADVASRAQLVRALAARNAVGAVPALMETAKDADETIRVESFKALAALAKDTDVPGLVGLLVSAQGEQTRSEAERTVATAAKTIADEARRGDALLAAYDNNTNDPAVRASLLTALSQVGAPSGLAPVAKAAMDANGAEQEAAVRALANWPTPAAIDDTLKLAQKAREESHRTIALRGLMRMLELPADRAMDATLGYYTKAMAAAKTPDDKKAILSGATSVRDRRILSVVLPCVASADLKQEANLAADKIKIRCAKATAYVGQENAERALDGKNDSGWSNGGKQAGGEWFMLDLGDKEEVASLVLDAAGRKGAWPAGYQVFVCDDPNSPGAPAAEGAGDATALNIKLATPKTGRYIKIVQTGKAESEWFIGEIRAEFVNKAVAN